jgi:hypothetical protein
LFLNQVCSVRFARKCRSYYDVYQVDYLVPIIHYIAGTGVPMPYAYVEELRDCQPTGVAGDRRYLLYLSALFPFSRNSSAKNLDTELHVALSRERERDRVINL